MAWTAVASLLQTLDCLREMKLHGLYSSDGIRNKITRLLRDLRFLLNDIDDCSNKWEDHELLKYIKDVADGCRDIVEEYMVEEQITYPLKALGNLSKEILSIKEQIQIIRGTLKNINDEVPSSESLSVSLRDLNKEEIVVGFDDIQLSILEDLTRLPSGLEIVTIVGMGGIGKTTLAKKLFSDPYTVYHFDCRAWITISQVYQLRDLLLAILSSVVKGSDKISEKSNTELAADLYRSLKGKRYFIVMDDMWSVDAWNDVKRCFPDDKVGSRIIVTSRSSEVASYVSPKKPPHLMNLLDTEKSWELLEKMVIGNASCPPELVEIGKQLAKRCGGLPLAIVVISGILSLNIKSPDSWKHIAENLISIVSTDPEQCLNILALSYIYLPRHLKASFLYIGAFPEDCEIEVDQFVDGRGLYLSL